MLGGVEAVGEQNTHMEHFQELFFGHDEPFKLLLFLHCLFGELFKSGIVGVGDWTVRRHLVEETIVGRGTQAEVAAVMTLGGLTEDVGRRMPKDLLA